MNLIDKIDSAIEADNLERRANYVRKGHWLSDLTSCQRKKYYSWTGVKETNPADSTGLFKMSMGNAVEYWLDQQLKKLKDVEILGKIRNNKKFDDRFKYDVRYELDNRFLYDGQVGVIECKSSYGRGVSFIQKYNAPKDDHLMQTLGYMNLENIMWAIIMYYGRDNGYRCQFELYKDGDKLTCNGKDISEKLGEYRLYKEKLLGLEAQLEKKELPDRDFKAAIRDGQIVDKFQRKSVEYKSDFYCNYCNYKDHCWENVLKKEGVFYGEEEIK